MHPVPVVLNAEVPIRSIDLKTIPVVDRFRVWLCIHALCTSLKLYFHHSAVAVKPYNLTKAYPET
jgi:hypothetical protein